MIDSYGIVSAWLNANRGRWPEIATKIGASYNWVVKVANRRIPNPGVKQINALMELVEKDCGFVVNVLYGKRAKKYVRAVFTRAGEKINVSEHVY